MAVLDVLGLVFDLPDDAWTAQVRRVRLAYDRDRIAFPVEITVAGSSGLGWFSPSQTQEEVAACIRTIAQSASPFECCFSAVEVFPASRVYSLALKDERPFHAFQQLLAKSVLQFDPVPFAYKPHCTIAALPDNTSASALQELAAFPVPSDRIAVSSVSLYTVNAARNRCRFAARFPLGA